MAKALQQRAEALAFIKCKRLAALCIVSPAVLAFYTTLPLLFAFGRARRFNVGLIFWLLFDQAKSNGKSAENIRAI